MEHNYQNNQVIFSILRYTDQTNETGVHADTRVYPKGLLTQPGKHYASHRAKLRTIHILNLCVHFIVIITNFNAISQSDNMACQQQLVY